MWNFTDFGYNGKWESRCHDAKYDVNWSMVHLQRMKEYVSSKEKFRKLNENETIESIEQLNPKTSGYNDEWSGE